MYLIKFLNFHSSNNHLHFITASQLQFISCTFFFSDKNFSNKYPCLLQNINVLYYIQTVPPTFLLYRSGAFSIGCVGGPGNSCLTVYKLLLVWPTYCDKSSRWWTLNVWSKIVIFLTTFHFFHFFLPLCCLYSSQKQCVVSLSKWNFVRCKKVFFLYHSYVYFS